MPIEQDVTQMPISDDGPHPIADSPDRGPAEENRPTLVRGTQSSDVVVVGAGPYGLSVAAHLLDAGMEVRVFGEPMAGWRHHMPKGMYLKSTVDASSLSAPGAGSSLVDYWTETGTPALDERRPVPIGMFIDYGQWFQERHVKDVESLQVRRVAAVPSGFRVSLANGEDLSARTVIVASGHFGYAHSPCELRTIAAAELVSHASQHSDFSRFSGRTVAVIGAGQSALESAVLLREAGAEVHLLVRGPSILWGNPPGAYARLLGPITKPNSPLGPGWSLFVLSRAPELVSYLPAPARQFLVQNVLGPSGAWWLRERFERQLTIALETRIEDARPSNGRLSLHLRAGSGTKSTLAVDHVIAATGYRVDLEALGFLDPALRLRLARSGGTAAPRLSRSFESSERGLYFTGLSAAPTFGPLMRFVCGTEFTARTIRRALTRSQSSNGFRES
jgi:thioredoxin reductase